MNPNIVRDFVTRTGKPTDQIPPGLGELYDTGSCSPMKPRTAGGTGTMLDAARNPACWIVAEKGGTRNEWLRADILVLRESSIVLASFSGKPSADTDLPDSVVCRVTEVEYPDVLFVSVAKKNGLPEITAELF